MNLTTTKLNLSSLVAGGVVVTVTVLIISSFVLRSLAGQLGQNNQLLSKKRAASSQLTKNIEAVEKLSGQYGSLGDRRILIKDALPTTPDFPAIVSMMEKLSSNAGVKLLSVSPSSTSTENSSNKPISYSFNANITGGYSSLEAFLKNIELSLRPMAVTDMKISGNTELLAVDMTISTYFQNEFDPTLKKVPFKKSSSSPSKAVRK